MTTGPTLTDGSLTLRLLDGGRGEITVDRGAGAAAGTGDAVDLERSLRRLLDRAFSGHGLCTVHWHVTVGDWTSRRVAP